MAENLFLKSPSAIAPTATAPVAPPMPAINTLPPRSANAGPLTSSAASVMSQGLLPPPDLQPLFEKYSAEFGVPLNVLSALAQQESGYDANAVGEPTKWGQAKGMLQNLDSNAKSLGIDPFNAEQAIAGAARQMRQRLDKGYSMEDVVKSHFGGDNRAQWGEKTQAYGQEVLAKASIIGDQLMANKPKAAAPGNDLAAIQAEMDAKEPGRYKVIDPADIAQRDQQRADIASGKGALANAQADAGGYDAPSPYTLENQQRIEDKVNAAPGLSPLTTKNQALTKAGFAPVADQPQDGFVASTKKSLQNLPEHFKNAAGGIIRTQGEGIDDQTLVSNAESAGIIQRMQDNGDIIMVQDARGQMTPTLRDGTNGDTSSLAKYLRTHARDLMTPEEAGALVGMKPSDITQLGKRLSKEANADTVQINPDGPLAKYGSMIIGSTAEMIPAIAASVITKNPAVGMSMIGGQVYGQSYDAARSKNLNPNDAATYAMAQAAAEAIPEALPIHVIMQPGQQFFKGLFKAGTAEALQETVTQAIQSGLDKGSIDPKMTWAQAREQIADAAIVGAGTGAALKAGVHGVQKAVDALPTRDREAEAAAAAQAQPAPADETQQAPAPEAAPVTPEPAPAPAEPAPAATGPLTRAAQQYVAPEPPAAPAETAPTGEPVTVRSADGEMAGTLEDYQDHGQGQWTARVLADDGNAYDFTQDDGVQLERGGQSVTPATEPAATAAPAPQADIPTLTDVVTPEARATPDYSSMDVPQLRAELKATATAIKAAPKDASLKVRRKAIEAAIKNSGATPTKTEAAPTAVADLTGDKIDKAWSRFADDSGSLNIPRADMPQIKAEHRGAMTQFLNARGIAHTQEEVPASSLKPTQEEFSPAKVKKALGFEGGDRSILISSDNHVLDGHHQWLAKVDGDQPVKVIRLGAPIKQLLDDVREFPSATTANGAIEAKAEVDRTDATAARQAAVDYVKWRRSEGAKNINAVFAGIRDGRTFTDSPPFAKAGELSVDRMHTFKIADLWKASAEPSAKAPAPEPAKVKPEAKPLPDTRGTGARFHGSSRPLPEGGPTNDGVYGGSVMNIYGGGFYTTDALDIATGYTKKGKGGTPTLYDVKEKGDVKLYDMGQPMPAKVKAIAQEVLGDYYPSDSVDGHDLNTLMGVYDEFRAESSYEGLTAADVQEYFDSIRAQLEDEGYRGLSHVGGQKTGNAAHGVNIYWNPEDDLSVTPTTAEQAAATKPVKAATKSPETASKPATPATDAANTAYGASNKLVSQDRATELRAKLKAKLNGSQLNSGIDPEILALGTELAVFHIEAGVRKFADFAKTMAEDLGQPLEKVRPYLRSWFNGARDMMEDAGHSVDGMDNADTVRAELAKLGRAPATEAKIAPVQTVTTPSGREFEVRPKVVEENTLITSNFVDGPVNPAYPKELQPRDRSRSASLDQINGMAKNLNPRLLGDSASATDGAPIVSPEGVVESGNGRTLAIRQAYALDNQSAVKYRDWLESQGYDVAGMASPILVRERVTPMTTEELQAYTTEANERTTLALSSTERAVADSKKLGDILHQYHGGDVAGAANREFVRAFIGDVASKSDRGSLMDGDGVLSQDGRRRIEAALLAAAYDDPALVNDIFESADSDIKSIGGALLDAAGPWAQMRQESRDGQISKSVDVTPNLMEAVNLVRQARARGKSILELVNQNDMFSGKLDQATKDWVSVFYRGASLARARGRDKVADALLTYTQLARATQPGTNLFGEPELTGADLIRGTHDQLDRQEAQATQQQGLFGDAQPDDQSAGARRTDGQRPAPGARSETPQQGSTVNAASPGERVEPNRTDRTAAKPVDATAVSDESGAAGRRTGEPGASDVESRADGQRDQRLPTDGAVTGRESGDQRVHQPDGAFRPTLGTAGGAESSRSGGDRVAGEPVERERAESIVGTAPATDASEFSERLAAQKKASGTPTVRGDKANIDAALPLLLEPQRDDVLKAEQRFAVGNGMLLTNGTGTGKTASGMGVIVRSINAGKPNALVVVPSDKIAADWIKFAKMLGVELKLLASTSDNGTDGQVITTYANFGANDSLALREWDQVVADEAHYLSSNEKGEGTGALSKLQGLTGHPDGFYQWVRERNSNEWQALQQAQAAMPEQEQLANYSAKDLDALTETRDAAAEAWAAIEEPAKKAWQDRWAKQQDLPKTLFLSATPFAYVKSVDYAEGYLFDYVSPAERYSNKTEVEGAGYNSGDAREKFFMQHFGYRMRYNKLTQPEAGVDSELMEQNFNQHLKEVGALSGRRLEVPYDYDRKFVMVDDAVGQKIDQGLAFLREHEDGKYREVYKAVMDTFDYQRRMYLLESIKARAVVPMIKEHMKLGRKVVVFHDYNKGGGFDPFQSGLASIVEQDVKALAREAFAARPDIFKKMDLKGLFSPIDTLAAAFPDALFFNGTVPKAKRRANADTFNDDASGKDLIVLQSDAGREGVSLHDTSGQHMRVLINLGMPGKPVAAIQIEGRTYRTGQASDAAFRYLTTGTAWEASAFASKIAERASTAENLALGTDARGLKQSFIDAYNGAEDLAPSAEDGKGGKAIDRELAANAALTPFQKAKSYYFAQQKNSKRRDQREGVDYFATPEPLGFKMAEWANIQKGDHVLEPSAGHGAIARFFPPQTHVTMIEPSYDLSQRAALANGNARIINDSFEALHLTNKYDAIVMNPPYGNGGKTAIEHVAKAAKHLREGGRVVALIPRGGLTDKRLAAFLESDEAQSLHRVATFDMPAATFERAGTAVNTQVIVLEKHSNPDDAQGIHARTINLSNAESTGELFDRIEHLDLPERTPTSKPEPKVELIEHITGRGKRLTGIVRTDLTKAEAEEIDGATFKKNGGWFIRSKYLGDGNRLSVAAPLGEPASHQDVRDAITQGPFGNVIKKLIDSGNIVVHGNVQSLPDGANVPGVQAVTTKDGKVHLVAANLTPGNANAVLLHELFHSGGETLVGSQRWAELIQRLDGLQRQAEQSTGKARAVFDRARERVAIAQRQGGVDEGMTAEEFGAYAIEEYEQLPKAFRTWVDDLVGAIKHWLFSRYGKQLGQVTPAQLRAMAKDALVSMALAKRGELFGPAGTMFSVRLADVFDDIKNDADATSFSDKIGPEKLPQRLADRWRQLTDNLALRFRQAAVDRYAPLMRNDQALYGADTLEGSIASSSWVLARMSEAAGGALGALLNNGRIYLDPKEKVIDLHDNSTGLKDTLKKLGGVAEMTRFMGWIAANRSKRLLGEGRENLFTPTEIEAGIKFSGGKLADGKSRSMLYQQVWKEFQQHRDDVLGIAEQSGIITPEQRTTWSNEFYVPFYRVIDSENLGGPRSGGGGLSRQQAFKKLKGGRQHLNDLLENTLMNFHHLIQASLKNQAATQAMENASHKDLGIATKTTEAHRDKKASTFVMEGGEKQWYNISDPLTFKAVSAITDAGVNTLSRRIMRGFKRFFTNMTTITPQFVVANAIRDTLSAMATSPTSAIPLKTAFKGALTYGNNHQRARMQASGGAFHFGQAYGAGAHEFKASLNGTMRTAQVLKDPMLIPNTLMKAWRGYHGITDFAENMNRAGIWEHNLDKGKLKAAFEARDLMDFSAHGDAGIIRFFTDVVPFLNARVQGLDKLYRSGGKPALKTLFGKGTKSDKQAFARFAAVVGALTAFSVMLYLRNKDDEDYRKLEDWQRDTYWVIKIGGNMFFIPKPFEVGSIATMGERLMEQFVDPTVGGDKLASRALHMFSDTFAMNPTPQAIKPLLELGYNENTFTGRPIEDQSMQRLSPSLRARPDTTRLAEASSRGIESALDVIGAGNSALSPVQIDHLIQGYLGAVGATAIGMADTFWRGAQGEELPARKWQEYQPIKRFYKDLTQEDNYTRYGTDFYNALKKSDQAYADLQHLAKYGEEEKAVALEGKQADVLALRGTLNKVNRDMSRINAEMKRIQVDKDMDGKTKRLELDRLRSMRNLMTEEIGKDLEQQKMLKRTSGGQ